MVKRCVVQFCTDLNKTGHKMQIFPNDANLKRQFVKFVQVKIADFVGSTKSAIFTVCFNIFNFFVMVKRCVVQFCTDLNKTGHKMQIFPNDANLKRQFVKFVQVKIADFVGSTKSAIFTWTNFTNCL